MIQLGVNIDHVATLRQARYPKGEPGNEPDPVRAMHEAELGGADLITVHLREDRRHINDRDVEVIRGLTRVRFNLEMAATDEMVGIAIQRRAHMATLVPEGRMEVTTEGGLDVAGQLARIREVVSRLRGEGIVASAFIDPEAPQIEAAAKAGFDACEIHTGPYAAAFAACGGSIVDEELTAELERVAMAGGQIRGAGMRFHAGHALNYANVTRIAALPGMAELHIGHAIVSRAVWTGLREAVGEMKRLMTAAAAEGWGGRGG